MFCIPKHLVDKFVSDLKEGKVDFDALFDMDSKQRREYFTEYFGDINSDNVNALFESKMILKHQKKGLIDWVKSVANLKPEAQKDIISRIDKMDKILNPKDSRFLEDLAAHRLGVAVTMEEAANISSLAKIVKSNEKIMLNSKRREQFGRPTETEMDYGLSVVQFEKYYENIIKKANEETLKNRILEFLTDPVQMLYVISGSAKAIRASMDNSFIGRQGIRLFYLGLTGDVRAGKTWVDTFFKSFNILYNSLKGKPVLDYLRAEILSDPEYTLMRKAKVATAVIEEEFPIHWPSQIPLIGRLFKASEDAFVGSAYYMRYRTAQQYFDIARNTGIDLTDKFELESIGRLVNSLTARGGKASNATPSMVNNVFWSPRMIRAHWDTLTGFRGQKVSAFTKRRAAVNLLRIIMGQAAVLFIASRIFPESVEWDIRSSDFGKIKIGSTRFDISGGSVSMMVLAARASLIIGNSILGTEIPETKSTTTGKLNKLNRNNWGRTGEDVVVDFIGNKLSPAASITQALLKGHTFDGKPITGLDILEMAGVPLIISNYSELANNTDSANIALALIMEGLGISAQTYPSKGQRYDND